MLFRSRYTGEMEEIAATFASVGVTPKFHEGAADLYRLLDTTPNLEERTRHQAEFLLKQISSALSPSNFLASNPVALKALAETSGESLVKGMQNKDTLERFHNIGAIVHTSSAEEFSAFVRSEHARWGEVIRSAGIKLD